MNAPDNTPAVRTPARRDPVPSSYSEAMQVGAALAKSGFFADARQEAQAAAKVIAGMELGIGPVAAMRDIYIVENKVSLGAGLIAALIKRSGRYDYRVTRLDDDACLIDFFQSGEPIGTSSFTGDDASKAGLKGRNWQTYRRNMLFARAMSNGARWYCADVFSGPVYVPEELGAEVDGETGEVLSAPAAPPTAPPADDPERVVRARYSEVFAHGAPEGESELERKARWKAIGEALAAAGFSREDLADDSKHAAAMRVAERAAQEHADQRSANANDAVRQFGGTTGEVINEQQMKLLHAKGRELGLDHDQLHQIAADTFDGIESMTEIPAEGMDRMLEAMEAEGAPA